MAKTSSTEATKKYRKFGLLDKISYAAGDFGCNMSFTLAGTFFTLFYTQYMGISSITFAGILIVLKIWDAINDPLIGGIIDSSRRKYKRGKFKTFISVGSVGLMISAALCFLPFPNAPNIIKIIMCLIGYMMWDAFYTIVNVPYGSMLSVISSDSGDRAQLSAWRSLGAMAASLPVGMLLPLIIYDDNNELLGARLFWVALALGFVGFIAFQFMVRTTVQRVEVDIPTEDSPKFSYAKAVKNFARNRPAIGATLAPVSMFLGTIGAATAVTVMFQSYFKNAAISGLLSIILMIPMLVFMPFIRKIVKRWGKKEAAQFGVLFSILGTLLMIFLPITPDGKGVAVFIGCQVINGIGLGIYQCVGNAMMGDAIDYNEWKNGSRDEGVTYALHSFFRKLAQGVGPSIGLVLMVALGYNEQLKANQPFEVAINMRYLVAAMYFFSAVLIWIALRFVYNLDKKTTDEMESALAATRAAKKVDLEIDTDLIL